MEGSSNLMNAFLVAAWVITFVLGALFGLTLRNLAISGGSENRDHSWTSPGEGDEFTYDQDARHPRTETVLRVGEPNGRGERLIQTQSPRGVVMTHRFRSDGSVAYYNVHDQ